jgi:hypothetical protein
MNENQLLERIRGFGHWRVLLRPTSFQEGLFPNLSEAWNAVSAAQIRLRGWDYPHIEEKDPHNEYIASGIDWNRHIELWRLYLSGQFVHYFAMFEDFDEVPWTSSAYPSSGKPAKYLEITSTVLHVTEITEFARRLFEHRSNVAGVELSLRLVGCEGRDLVYWHIGRLLSGHYRSRQNEVEVKETVSIPELVANSDKLAIRLTARIFELFNWINPPTDLMEEDQRRLLERRL